jgi:hypothetical protein
MLKDFARVRDFLSIGGRFRRDGNAGDRPDGPTIGGVLTMQMRERGKIVPGSRREGHNIWTLTGREFIVETITLKQLAPTRQKHRDDALLYFGLGSGVQPEVAEVARLLNPVEYLPGEFLAQAQVPSSFPASATGSARTAVRLIREYATHELSMGAPVTITEFGCFTDGDPANSNIPGRPTGMGVASTQAPVGYKTFDPFTKTPSRTLEVIYELRVI